MSESFDEFQPAPNEWDEFQPANPGPSTRDVLKAVSSIDPAQASKASKLAKKYNAADEVLLRTLQDAEMVDRINTATTKLDKAPVLADYMRNSPFVAAQSQKDIDPLVKMGEQMRAPRTALGTLGDIGVTALKGVVGLPQSLVGLVDIPTLGGFGKDLETLGVRFKDTQNFLSSLYSPAQQQANQVVSEADGFVGTLGAMLQNPSTIATTVGQSAPQMLGGAAIGRGLVAVAPRVAPWLSAALGEGIISAGGAAEQTREQTDDGRLTVKQSLSAVASGGGTALFGAVGGKVAQRLGLADIDTALVARGVDKTSAQAAKTGFISAITKAGVSEGVFEELPQSVQEQMWQNYANDRPINEGVGAAAAQGLLAGLSMGSGFQVLAEGGQRIAARAQQADAAAQDAAKLQNLMTSAAEATLRQNNPETFAQLVQHMADNTEGAPKSVYIDAQVFNQAVQTLTPEQLAQAFPSVTPEQIAEAVTTNSTVEVPIGEALAAVPGTPLEQVFLQNARSAPDALSLADAQTQGEQAAEWIKTEAERVLQQAQDQAAWQTSSDAVRTTILDQLNQAGRFTPEVNEAYALLQMHFFSTMAARTGVTPQELYDRFSLKVAAGAQQAADAGSLEQGGGYPLAPRLMAVHNLSADNLIFADKMGGLAVPSIGVVGQDFGGVDGFGEITLLGRKDLVDPKRERVFSADAYTVRFPKPEWPKAKSKDAQALVDFVRAAAKEFDDGGLTGETWDNMVNSPDAAKVVETWVRSSAVKAIFLREKGVDVLPVMRPVRTTSGLTAEQVEALRPLYEQVSKQHDEGQYGSPEEAELKQRVEDGLRETYAELGKRDVVVDKMVEKATQRVVDTLYRDVRAIQTGPTVDTWDTSKKISEQIEPYAVEFKQWVEAKIIPKFGDPFIKVGSKKAPYTLDNIVKTMTDTKVKGKEKTMTYGAGQVRAAASVEFSDLEQMRAAAAESIVNPEQYEAAKKETEQKLDAYRSAVVEFTKLTNWKGDPDTWEAMDASMRALAKWATGKKRDAAAMKAALRAENFDVAKVPAEVIQQAIEAAESLLRAPVPYFEAKPQRAVSMGEFAGAVIPADAPQAVRDVLAKNGVAVTEYAPGTDRTAVVRQFAAQMAAQGQDTLFQTATSLPPTIEIDGKQRPTTNSNGQPIAQTEEGVRNFWAWFGDSKVVDTEGRPLVVYHGTRTGGFDTFAENKRTRTTGFVFTSSKPMALTYSGQDNSADPSQPNSTKAGVYEVYLSLQDPELADWGGANFGDNGGTDTAIVAALATGSDGAIFRNVNDPGGYAELMQRRGKAPDGVDTTGDVFVVFDPTQIKSAIGNDGTFDPASPSILNQQARGTFNPQTLLITLNENTNRSTFLHESGHFFLEVMADLAAQPDAPAQVREDMDKLLAWFGIKGDENVGGQDAGGSSELAQAVEQGYEGSDAGEAREWLTAVAKGLDMSLEARMQRAQAMGFDTSKTLYHSTLADTKEFAPFGQFMGFTGTSGISVTDSPEMASRYLDRYAEYGWVDGKPNQAFSKNVIPVFIKPGKVLERNEPFPMPPGMRLGAPLPADYVPAHKKMGYDTLVRDDAISRKGAVKHSDAKNAIRGKEYVLTDPSQVRSIFAAFDPDNAASGNLLAQDGNLPTDNTQPAGRTPLEAWRAMTLDQKRQYHEKFAESFEAYLLEGKAPSTELQPLFRRFRSWLVNVYKSLKEFMRGRDLNMNDEVRQVFDRMLATDEQIRQAEEAAGMLPDFDATNEAIEKLQARSLRDLKWTIGARSRALKALQKEAANLRKAVEAEVRAEVDDMPVYQAQAAIDRIKGEPSTEQLETIAEATGFTSASEMLTTIGKADTKAAMIEGMTDQRMLENFGELATPQAIEEAANDAVHNEARARALATELKAQADALNPRQQTGTDRNGRPVTVNALVAAAKQFAENITARRKVKDLKKAAAQHRAAEARAGKAWQEATAKGKTQEAVQAKRDQMLNNYAAKSMQEADAEITKVIDYFKKFDKDTIRKNIPSSYLDQIDALLENMDLRKSVSRTELERRASLRKWVESQQAIGLDPIVPDELMENAQRISYKEMTVDELRAMRDVIKNIEHLGRLKSKLLAAKDKREFDAAVDAWAKEIRDNGGKPLPVKLEGDSRPVKMFKSAWADHRKLNSLIRQFAANADNSEGFKLLIRSMNERGTQEDVMIEKASVRLAEIHAPIEKLPGGFSGAKLFIPEINNSLTRAGRLAVALNWGNEQNRQRVRDGDNWTNEQVDAILRTLSPVELKFVNDVWEYLDSYWPEIKAKQERVSGVVEDKVQADPFTVTLADGTEVQMRGGYYPIKYDGDRSLKSQKQEAEQIAKDMLRGAMLRPATRRGHTKARVDEVIGRPVKKDLSVITQHVTQVVHDLTWHEWAIDANRLMNDPRIASAIRDYYGAETHRAMTDAIEAIVVGDVAKQTSIDQLLLMMRANVTRSIMGASLTTALLQPFGLTQSMARIGVTPVLKGAGRWAGDALRMESTVKWVGEKSDFMRLRSKTFNRELREISQRVRGKSKIAQVADASLFMLMQKMQLVADIPTWVGAYEKALNSGAEEATAVQLADEAVLSSQGGGNTRDLAAVQRDHPFLTQFYSYFNTTLQLVTESTAATDFKNPRAVAGWLGDMMLLAVVPAILPALITFSLKGGGEDDEPEEWAKRLVEWQAGYMLGMFVGLRELPALWSPFDYGGPPAAKLINDGRRLVQQANQGEIDEPAVLATIGFLGTALGIPTTQIVRSYKGWKAWDEGDAPASSILFGPPPKD